MAIELIPEQNLANIHINGIESKCFEIQGLQRAVDDSYSHYIHAYDIVHAYFTITPTHHCEVQPCVQSKESAVFSSSST